MNSIRDKHIGTCSRDDEQNLKMLSIIRGNKWSGAWEIPADRAKAEHSMLQEFG